MADHSQAPVTRHDRPAGRARRAGRARPGAPGRGRAAPREPSSRGSPSAPPSAPRWSTRCTSPSATRCAPRSSRSRAAIEGVDLHDVARARRPRRPREGVIASPERGELRFAPGGAAARRARRALERRRASWRCSTRRRGRASAQSRLPRRARARLVGAARARPRARCCCRPRPATSSSTGAARRTSAAAATARCTRSDSLGALVICGGVELPDPEPAQWAIRDVAAARPGGISPPWPEAALRRARGGAARLTLGRWRCERLARPASLPASAARAAAAGAARSAARGRAARLRGALGRRSAPPRAASSSRHRLVEPRRADPGAALEHAAGRAAAVVQPGAGDRGAAAEDARGCAPNTRAPTAAPT